MTDAVAEARTGKPVNPIRGTSTLRDYIRHLTP